MNDLRVGVVGGYGAVGRSAVRQLAAWQVGRLRLGGRHLEAAQRLIAEELRGVGEARRVDVEDDASLARFCAGCEVVLHCAGPAHRTSPRVARAALLAGAHYVDAAGDEATSGLTGIDLQDRGRAAVLGAGMLPGLSGLLPRALASGLDSAERLTAYAGGLGRFTPTAAADYLASLTSGYGEPLAAWRDGRRMARALAVLRDVELPFFPGLVTAHPYLSMETERLAKDLGLAEARWYNVFDGDRLSSALGRAQAGALGETVLEAAAELSRAADLDLFARKPYQLMVFQIDGRTAGRPTSRTLAFHGADASELTGAAAALATRAASRGAVPAGLHHAAEVLDPAGSLDRLRGSAAVSAAEIIDQASGAEPGATEQGVL